MKKLKKQSIIDLLMYMIYNIKFEITNVKLLDTRLIYALTKHIYTETRNNRSSPTNPNPTGTIFILYLRGDESSKIHLPQ